MSIIVDSRGMLVLPDADHTLHAATRALLEHESVIVPSSVVCEVDYMATARLGAATAQTFLGDLVNGAYDLMQVELTDMQRALTLIQSYGDAYIVALAERYRVPRILRLNRGHFSMFRLKGLGHLELLP